MILFLIGYDDDGGGNGDQNASSTQLAQYHPYMRPQIGHCPMHDYGVQATRRPGLLRLVVEDVRFYEEADGDALAKTKTLQL